MNYKLLLIPIFLFLVLTSLTSCGTDRELEEYKINMESFYSDISRYDSVINSINVESEDSTREFLTALDYLEERFLWMASLPVPEEFSSVEAIALEAGDYMSNAVSLFHQAYEGEAFDPAAADRAREYYIKANQRAKYILSILHGAIPEENGNYL